MSQTRTADANYRQPRFSPSGDRVAVETSASVDTLPDVWVIEVESGATARITTAPNWDYAPVWSADGKDIFFASSQRGRSDFLARDAGGVGAERLLLRNPRWLVTLFPSDVSRDGQFALFGHIGDIWAVRLTESGETATNLFPVVEAELEQMHAALSPDGRWLAYASSETGRHQIYVRLFQPGAGAAGGSVRAVSTEGGAQPRWRGDGKELFYLGQDGVLRAVPITNGSELRIGATSRLFASGIGARRVLNSGYSYDVSRDGQRFIVSRDTGASGPVINVVLNWQASLEDQ